MKKIGLTSCLLLILFVSCNKDSEITSITEENLPPEMIDELSDLRNEVISTLVGTTSKVWKISEATLVAQNNSLDITDNFNVDDDEFIFSTNSENNQLEWRIGHTVNTNANTVSETLLDYYLSPKNLAIQFKPEGGELLAGDGLFNLQILDKVPTLSINNEDGTQFQFTLTALTEKNPGDYFAPPSTDFEFSEVASFRSDRIDGGAPGMIGSYSDNSMFIVTRKDFSLDTSDDNEPEQILKFDLTNNEQSESLFANHDFISKQLHIINNQLIVVGGRFINTYNSDLSNTPKSIEHGKNFTRFGMAVQNDHVYIIGGEFEPDNTAQNDKANKVYQWNLNTETLIEFATLPEPRFGARATVVNDKLYIFGGSTDFFGDPSSEILVTSLTDGVDWQVFDMGNAMQFTYVNKYQNLIFIAGKNKGSFSLNQAAESFIGVFDTNTNEFTEINHNLEIFKEADIDAIHQMCLFNDKMYVLYGSGFIPGNPVEQETDWKIYATDIN